MIVDSSAIMAILEDEAAAPALLDAALAGPLRMSTATWLEAAIVADQRSASHGERFDELLAALHVELVPVTTRDALLARRAYRRYGRGSGSPARLDYGDCFAYALAVTSGEPLLFTGEDFPRTDVLPALEG